MAFPPYLRSVMVRFPFNAQFTHVLKILELNLALNVTFKKIILKLTDKAIYQLFATLFLQHTFNAKMSDSFLILDRI